MVNYSQFGDVRLERTDAEIAPLACKACLSLLYNLDSIVPSQDLTRRHILVNMGEITVDARTACSSSKYLIIKCYTNNKQVKVTPALINIVKKDKLERDLSRTFPGYEIEFTEV